MSAKKTRPYSSKPVTSIPIYIDETQIDSDFEETVAKTYTNKKAKLNQIIPQFPAFSMKSNSTSLLYSKFIMKDMKKDKIPLVKRAFKKKQEITEAQTNPNIKSRHYQKEISHKQSLIQEKQFYINDSKVNDLQFNNFLRTNSAKTFKKKETIDHQYTPHLVKNSTQANLKRPRTAVKRQDNKPAKVRPTSGYSKKYERVLYDDRDTVGHLDNLIKVNDLIDSKIRPTDHVKKNVREVTTAFSKKSSSIYLTGANIQEFKASKHREKDQNKNEYEKALDFRKKNSLKEEQKKKIEQKSKKFDNYLKQKMPGEYIKAFTEKENREDELISIGFERPEKQQQKIVDQIKAEQYYYDLLRNCDLIQVHMSKKVKTQRLEDKKILDIFQCQKVLQLNKRLKQEYKEEQRKGIIGQIYNIVKVLSYFRNKSQEYYIKLLSLPFQLQIIDQESVIIKNGQQIKNIFIIINGSVTSKTHQDHEDSFMNSEQDHQLGAISLYDGESFGQPQKPSQENYNVTVSALQQTILLTIGYQSYRQQFLQGSESEEKRKLLSLVFHTELSNNLLKEQDIQIMSVFLQSELIQAKKLVCRKGQPFDKFILIGRGQLLVINEQIIKRKKQVIKDMKQRPKSSLNFWRKQKIPTLNQMRKENLINYELLKETSEDIYYYHLCEEKKIVQGDSLNWKIVYDTLKEYEKDGKMRNSKINHQNTNIPFSLMSNSDLTKVFTISEKALKTLPSELKKIFLMKAEVKIKDQQILQEDKTQQMKNWENYKQNLCQQIIKAKIK